ncbi:MAG TPA: orotate phosphoribosyltransferase [Thermomicrobiales bacterium]|nr:orotate phosphoribosyltransferase [Thermomicrobiales bacterium]HQZ89582.1 orotate phosphoribosyltransferase [Thermomicrobiales bacterium]HRA31163.1 orotate phosphoribosyltransferase [Thermomicrobiales bacterium]
MSGGFLDQLRAIGALKSGHFLLASGRHSGEYVEKFDLLRNPRATESACHELVIKLGAGADVDLVVGPTTGGILLAFEIGRQLGLPAAYAERATEGSNERAFKRGTTIAPGTRVLLVDDILTTGGSIRETLIALGQVEADVRAIAVLVDRSGGAVSFSAPLVPLASLSIETWPAGDCPLCQSGQPLTKPGSTASSSQD